MDKIFKTFSKKEGERLCVCEAKEGEQHVSELFLFLHPNRGEWIPPNHHYFDETGVAAAVSKFQIFFIHRNTFPLSPHLPFRRICLANNYRLSYTTFPCSFPPPSHPHFQKTMRV